MIIIHRVQFRHDVAVSVGGKHATIGEWTRDKHGREVEVEVYPGGVYLWIVGVDGKRTGRRRNVLSTSISYIDEEVAGTTVAGPSTKVKA